MSLKQLFIGDSLCRQAGCLNAGTVSTCDVVDAWGACTRGYVTCTCRYMRLYNAAIKDRAFTYAWFFLLYLVHIAFCIWSAIAPPLPMTNDWSHTGYIVCLKAFDANTFTGVIYVIGAVLWTMEALWSFWCMKSVSACVQG